MYIYKRDIVIVIFKGWQRILRVVIHAQSIPTHLTLSIFGKQVSLFPVLTTIQAFESNRLLAQHFFKRVFLPSGTVVCASLVSYLVV